MTHRRPHRFIDGTFEVVEIEGWSPMKMILRIIHVGGFILFVIGLFEMHIVTSDFINAPTNPDINWLFAATHGLRLA